MGQFSKDEIRTAFDHYTTVVEECSRSGDWRPFGDLFTEDCHYSEHHYGEMTGRETVRAWIVAVMAPFPHMRFPTSWETIDEENGAVVMEIRNLLDHPTEPGVEFWFPNWTRIVYAGDNLWSSEEDVYNPERDAGRVVGEWLDAGGRFASNDFLQPGQPVPPLTS